MFKFNDMKNPHIFLIGTGGTGGFFLDFFCRLTRDNPIPITLIDGDSVEGKNLNRQNFTSDDIDLKKTDALKNKMESYHESYKGCIASLSEYVKDDQDLLVTVLSHLEDGQEPIIISALDNVETRRLVNEVLEDLKDAEINTIALDSGNTDQTAQVVVYSNYPVDYKETPFSQAVKKQLKSMLEIYPDLDVINDDTDRNPAHTQSCGDLATTKPQIITANLTNAVTLTNLVHHLIENKPLHGNVYESSLYQTMSTIHKIV